MTERIGGGHMSVMSAALAGPAPGQSTRAAIAAERKNRARRVIAVESRGLASRVRQCCNCIVTRAAMVAPRGDCYVARRQSLAPGPRRVAPAEGETIDA